MGAVLDRTTVPLAKRVCSRAKCSSSGNRMHVAGLFPVNKFRFQAMVLMRRLAYAVLHFSVHNDSWLE